MYRKWIKRVLDIVLSLLTLILLCPLIGVIAVLVKIKLGSPVIFKQIRPGKDEVLFSIYKFRTMTDEKDENGDLLPDTERLPRFGRVLRSTSMDELPELINIIKGEMSIVGPRPLVVEYIPYYNEREHHRHDVRPGLTGLAQVNGRNNLKWEERFEYDIYYAENISFLLDIKILFKTVHKVLRHEDIVPLGEGVEEDFNTYRERQYAKDKINT